jgi:hypothetical protein
MNDEYDRSKHPNSSATMIGSRRWPPETVRAAITMAQQAVENVRPEDELILARAALERAVELLDASDRELGVFHDAEPYRIVLDPLPHEAPKPLLLQAPVERKLRRASTSRTASNSR